MKQGVVSYSGAVVGAVRGKACILVSTTMSGSAVSGMASFALV